MELKLLLCLRNVCSKGIPNCKGVSPQYQEEEDG